jgi:4-oxalocrotonate tautomerase family enzyme
MPIVHIDILKRGVREKRALVTAVTEAIQTSLGVPLESISIVINEMATDQYAHAGVLLVDKPAFKAKARRAARKK